MGEQPQAVNTISDEVWGPVRHACLENGDAWYARAVDQWQKAGDN